MSRIYPIGEQHFSKIREANMLYVDKTKHIHELVTTGKYYFLSRPRRFGKSLLITTIKELFKGNKNLFEGLWIYDQWHWDRKFPVINIRISKIEYEELGLNAALLKEFDYIAAELGLTLYETELKTKFWELIKKASQYENVVILIDEYDKPIMDYLDDLPRAEENRAVFKRFYSVLKDAGEYIRLLLITGVSRFSKVSIFSDLNNLNDITLSARFAAIAGITQEELEHNFAPEIEALQKENADILTDIKTWYNGYSWDAKTRVYNPFSLLNFMAEPVFRNYWFATGSPSFLIKKIKANGEYNFDHTEISELSLGNFDVSDTLSAPLLFQTGYLTIKSYNADYQSYELDFPNKEVKASLLDALLSAYREVFPGDSMAITGHLRTALNKGDIPAMVKELNGIIGSIPFDHWRADTESIFHIIVFLTFKKVGVDVYTEVHSNKGRCDVVVKTDRFIYVIELKLDGTASDALNQVIDTKYLQPYEADHRKKLALDISFSSANREIAEYLSEEL